MARNEGKILYPEINISKERQNLISYEQFTKQLNAILFKTFTSSVFIHAHLKAKLAHYFDACLCKQICFTFRLYPRQQTIW